MRVHRAKTHYSEKYILDNLINLDLSSVCQDLSVEFMDSLPKAYRTTIVRYNNIPDESLIKFLGDGTVSPNTVFVHTILNFDVKLFCLQNPHLFTESEFKFFIRHQNLHFLYTQKYLKYLNLVPLSTFLNHKYRTTKNYDVMFTVKSLYIRYSFTRSKNSKIPRIDVYSGEAIRSTFKA